MGDVHAYDVVAVRVVSAFLRNEGLARRGRANLLVTGGRGAPSRRLCERTRREAKGDDLLEPRIEGLELSNVHLCIKKVNETSDETGEAIRETVSNAEVRTALQRGEVQAAAGTVWLWAREEFFESLDVLVVAEAGQMSLASVLAAAQAARSIILLGEPRQLEQPLQGSHTEGTALSGLQHVLGDHEMISDDRGLFLNETWRLHPAICTFTSEMFYESRPDSQPYLDRQQLEGSGPLKGARLWFHDLCTPTTF